MQPQPDHLRNVIRQLGAVLGDVIREEDGEKVFQQIEDLRQASVAFHRNGGDGADTKLADRLAHLSVNDAVRFAHSFACFLQITNIAEDHVQRHREGSPDEWPDTLAGALRALKEEGTGVEQVVDLLDRGLIVPVLTAHPSEVRRKSVIDRQAAIGQGLQDLEGAGAADQRAAIETEIKRQVAIFWRTRLLRGFKINVTDEIDTAVS